MYFQITRELCSLKQHYESIVPQKSGINTFSASLFPQILHYDVNLSVFDVILNKGHNSVEQNAIVPGTIASLGTIAS